MEIKKSEKLKRLGEAAIVFLACFLLYHLSNLKPLDWYQHFLYLARAFLEGRVDIWGFPEFYHDVVRVGGKVYMPFPPIPAVALMPLVAIWGTGVSQMLVCKIVAAANVALVWLLLGKLKIDKKLAVIVTGFFAFGTVHWYAAVIGTTWFFAHVVGVGAVLLALTLFFEKKAFWLQGILVGAAALSRHPMLFSSTFWIFLLFKKRQWQKLLMFLVGVGMMGSLQLTYNYLRFGNLLEEGYVAVYEQYVNSGLVRTVLTKYRSQTKTFGYMDVRNVPLHLVTMLIWPPETMHEWPYLKPDPLGMGVVLTSPLLMLVFCKTKLKRRIGGIKPRELVTAGFVAAGLTMVPVSLHYMQGWVQFGYRFLLDAMPFLIVILAIKLAKRPIRWVAILATVSVVVNGWGIYWAKALGW